MRYLTILAITLFLYSCNRNGKSSINLSLEAQQVKTDTLLYYWPLENDSYIFDTLLNETHFKIKTFCLNDSAIYNETYSEERSKNNRLIEFSVAHNYATDFIISPKNGTSINIRLLKDNFKNSIPTDLYKICHMWKNEFSHIEEGRLICRATFAQPDTDYQVAILYNITGNGEFEIVEVVDESLVDTEGE